MKDNLVVKTISILETVLMILFVIVGISISVILKTIVGAIAIIVVALIWFMIIKFMIPKKYKDKDERMLLIELVSLLIAQSIFGFTAYLCFTMSAIGVLEFENGSMMFFNIVIVLVIATQLIKLASGKILERII